jgi:hypothetical protein
MLQQRLLVPLRQNPPRFWHASVLFCPFEPSRGRTESILGYGTLLGGVGVTSAAWLAWAIG